MARLSAEQWEQARAEYEVRGASMGDIARKYGVTTGAVCQRAKKEGWIQGKTKYLVDKKVSAIKALAEFGMETKNLPYNFRHTIETVARERLQAEGLLANFDVALAAKGLELLQTVESIADFELLARSRRHLAQQKESSTTVNVNQQQAQGFLSPRDAIIEMTCDNREDE